MTIEKINPPGLAEPMGYAHITIARGTTRVYVAGQTGVGLDGAVVGHDLPSQAAQAFRNVTTALAAAGATWDDVVQMNILVVKFDPSMTEAIFTAAAEALDGELPVVTATLYGVHSLFDADHLIEVDAVAELA